MTALNTDADTSSKREWRKPEIAALKVDLRSVAQANDISADVHKASAAQAS